MTQNLESRKSKAAIHKKQHKKSSKDLAFKAFILPQYHQLIENNFLNNNLPLKLTSIECKQKLKDISNMILTSSEKFKAIEEGEVESSQLKNEQTVKWLKKRFSQQSNKKYLGNEEDAMQLSFIKSMFEVITKQLKSSKLIPITEFHSLLVSYELPMIFTVLQKIYQVVDEDKDGALNFKEFQQMNMNEQANQLYLDQFKMNYKQFATMPVKPTSLSSFCLFVAFRVNHDFLTEFLYDSNFQVKDKSQGLIKMFDLIKMQGQIKIKSDFDKRIIRKLHLDNSPILGFVNSKQKNQKNQPQTSYVDDKIEEISETSEMNIPEIKEHLESNDFQESSSALGSRRLITKPFTHRPFSNQKLSALSKQSFHHIDSSSPQNRDFEREDSSDYFIKPKRLDGIQTSRNAKNQLNYIPQGYIPGDKSMRGNHIINGGIRIESPKKWVTQFEASMQSLVERANKKGEQNAQDSFLSKQDLIKEIQQKESSRTGKYCDSSLSTKINSNAHILPNILDGSFRHSRTGSMDQKGIHGIQPYKLVESKQKFMCEMDAKINQFHEGESRENTGHSPIANIRALLNISNMKRTTATTITTTAAAKQETSPNDKTYSRNTQFLMEYAMNETIKNKSSSISQKLTQLEHQSHLKKLQMKSPTENKQIKYNLSNPFLNPQQIFTDSMY